MIISTKHLGIMFSMPFYELKVSLPTLNNGSSFLYVLVSLIN